jgi:hypothetical protein
MANLCTAYAQANFGLRSIQSRRLWMNAQRLYIRLPNLKWEEGPYGDQSLNEESFSVLFHAVKEKRAKALDTRRKLAGAITGIIGTLIGLVAVWKKK